MRRRRRRSAKRAPALGVAKGGGFEVPREVADRSEWGSGALDLPWRMGNWVSDPVFVFKKALGIDQVFAVILDGHGWTTFGLAQDLEAASMLSVFCVQPAAQHPRGTNSAEKWGMHMCFGTR